MAQSAVEPLDPFYSFGERIKHTPSRREKTAKTLEDAVKEGNKQGVPVSNSSTKSMKFKPRNSRQGLKTAGTHRDMPQASPNPHRARARDAKLQQLVQERAKKLN